MINQKFDILNKPVLSCYNAAYLVDYKNVELHRQYVAKYYSSHDLHWFDATIKGPIFNDKRCNYYYIITKDILESATGTYYLQHLVLV